MFKVKVEGLGSVSPTEKGFIRQFLVTKDDGQKDVIKVFSKDAGKLAVNGPQTLEVKQDFFFAV